MNTRDPSTVNPPSLAEVADERDRLRAAIIEAVQELSDHQPDPSANNGWCVICSTADGSWPCLSKMVADDLAKALES